MLTALMVAMVVTCKPYHPVPPPQPPQVTTTQVRCEGTDQVRRNMFGEEIGRVLMACTTVRCEGSDWVRRAPNGAQVERRISACRPPAQPVRLTTQPGWKFGLKAT